MYMNFCCALRVINRHIPMLMLPQTCSYILTNGSLYVNITCKMCENVMFTYSIYFGRIFERELLENVQFLLHSKEPV